ncbi:MAG: hypothetical protein AAF222_15470 [Pseudomonadota bacterium]
MTNELLTLIVTHIACSNMAAERPLSIQEVQYCSAVYQEIKLAFVPGLDRAGYTQLAAQQQHSVNLEGYRAFYKWRVENPSTVQHLERVARGERELGQAS